MEFNKKLSLIVTELLLRGRKLKISLVFLYHTLISKCLKRMPKCNVLFDHENS